MLPTGVSNWIRHKAPPAIAGSGGHGTTYNVACSLWRMLADESAVWQGLIEYNAAKCSPAWSERELRHKLTEAETATRGERDTPPNRAKYGNRASTVTEMRQALARPASKPNPRKPAENAQTAIPPASPPQRITGVYSADEVRALKGELLSITVWPQDPARYLVEWRPS